MEEKSDGKAKKGGLARAESLSPRERREIASIAASSRWHSDLPQAAYEGSFKLGEREIQCAVLPNGQRIIIQGTFLTALGRSRSPKSGTGVLSTVDGLPFFLQAKVLEPYISDELKASTTPIFYRTKGGGKGVGYNATLLPQVAEVYLRYRDETLSKKGEVSRQYSHIVRAADILMRGLANVGIVALIDEATGYQRDRAKDALAKILEQFIAKELRPWVRTFPDDYYQELFRLRGLSFPGDTVKRPQYFGHLTNDIVYSRLAPMVLEELKKLTPRKPNGQLKHHYHRRLTEDIGHPKLREHLSSVVSLMRISDTYDQFQKFLDKAHPRYGETLPLPLEFKDEKGL